MDRWRWVLLKLEFREKLKQILPAPNEVSNTEKIRASVRLCYFTLHTLQEAIPFYHAFGTLCWCEIYHKCSVFKATWSNWKSFFLPDLSAWPQRSFNISSFGDSRYTLSKEFSKSTSFLRFYITKIILSMILSYRVPEIRTLVYFSFFFFRNSESDQLTSVFCWWALALSNSYYFKPGYTFPDSRILSMASIIATDVAIGEVLYISTCWRSNLQVSKTSKIVWFGYCLKMRNCSCLLKRNLPFSLSIVSKAVQLL